jgi:polysaccharide export outer membrane protein
MLNFGLRVSAKPFRNPIGVCRSLLAGGGWIVICLLCSLAPARAEYRVDAGDVIEIFVARVPDLQRRVSVKLDGTISVPYGGTISVAGLSASELQAKVRAVLATKVFQQRESEGHAIAVDPDEIVASVAEYRPVYVNGDVSKPGEYPYRPLMTVRQAIAMSGSYDFIHAGMANPLMESADLRADYSGLWADVAREQARTWRIRSELGDQGKVDRDTLLNVPLPRPTITQIVGVEAEHLAVSQADYQRQKAFLEHSIKQGNEQLGVLSDQQQKEDEAVQADTDELQKLLDLYSKGAVAVPRVTDARRALMLSSTRKLQTDVQLIQMKKQHDELVRQTEKLDDERKITLLQQLQESEGKINSLRARLQGVAEKLRYASARVQIARGGDIPAKIAVIRKAPAGRERLAADEDFELEPGDVVEVTLIDRAVPLTPDGAGSPTGQVPQTGAIAPSGPTPSALIKSGNANPVPAMTRYDNESD